MDTLYAWYRETQKGEEEIQHHQNSSLDKAGSIDHQHKRHPRCKYTTHGEDRSLIISLPIITAQLPPLPVEHLTDPP